MKMHEHYRLFSGLGYFTHVVIIFGFIFANCDKSTYIERLTVLCGNVHTNIGMGIMQTSVCKRKLNGHTSNSFDATVKVGHKCCKINIIKLQD